MIDLRVAFVGFFKSLLLVPFSLANVMAMNNATGFLPPRNAGASSSANRLAGEYELSDDLNRRQLEVKLIEFALKSNLIVFQLNIHLINYLDVSNFENE